MSSDKHCPHCGAAVTFGVSACPGCNANLDALWVDTGEVPAASRSGQLGQPPATPLVQPGASSKPWPFSAELLSERLAAGGFMQKPVVDALRAEASASSRSLVDLILERRQMAPAALRDAMSRIFGLPVADLATVSIDPNVVTKAPAEFARNHLLLPLHAEGDRLVVVCADPTQSEVIRTVRKIAGLTVDLRLASRDELAPKVYQYFSPRLVVVLPSGQTMDIVVHSGEMKIGRAEHNEIVLPDPTVGSTHAIIRAHGNEYQIVDFGSRNGVFVDNSRINQSQVLRNGDVIKIGQCLLTFKLPIPDAAQSHDGATQILSADASNAAVAALLRNVQANPAVAAASAAGGAGFVAGGSSAEVEDDDKARKKEKKRLDKEKKEKEKAKENEKLKSAWIGFVGRIVAQIVGAVATIVLGLMIAGKMPGCSSNGDSGTAVTPPPGVSPVDFSAFGEMNPIGEIYNSSAIVEIAPGKFIFADNNTNDSLFELNVDASGAKAGSIVRHPLVGVQPGQLDDIEGLALAKSGDKTIIFATTSMMYQISKKKGQFEAPPSALLRITVQPDGALSTEVIPDIRQWFAANVAEIGGSTVLEPDKGGLNIEGLGYDPNTTSLMFGVRTPVIGGKAIVVPVKINDLAGPWVASNLTAQPPIHLAIEASTDEQGIRDISYDPVRKAFLVIVGNSTSLSKAAFMVYQWDGASSEVKKLSNVFFVKGSKPEGLTRGTVGTKSGIVFVDDNGGFRFLPDDDSRLH